MTPDELGDLMKFDPTNLPIFFDKSDEVYNAGDTPRFGVVKSRKM